LPSRLLRARQKACAQSFADWELVIISDDGQDYAEILAAQGIVDARILHVSSGAIGSGCALPRNTGLASARGRYIAALDADDAFLPNRLEVVLPLAEQHGYVISSFEQRLHESGALVATNQGILGERFIAAQEFPFMNCYASSLMMFDRQEVRLDVLAELASARGYMRPVKILG
jgi:glycosyltransferase involved in cell wall biosynthesis